MAWHRLLPTEVHLARRSNGMSLAAFIRTMGGSGLPQGASEARAPPAGKPSGPMGRHPLPPPGMAYSPLTCCPPPGSAAGGASTTAAASRKSEAQIQPPETGPGSWAHDALIGVQAAGEVEGVVRSGADQLERSASVAPRPLQRSPTTTPATTACCPAS